MVTLAEIIQTQLNQNGLSESHNTLHSEIVHKVYAVHLSTIDKSHILWIMVTETLFSMHGHIVISFKLLASNPFATPFYHSLA